MLYLAKRLQTARLGSDLFAGAKVGTTLAKAAAAATVW